MTGTPSSTDEEDCSTVELPCSSDMEPNGQDITSQGTNYKSILISSNQKDQS